MYLWVPKTRSLPCSLGALLTVIGYSVNDTVVVFDRVREKWAAAAGKVPFRPLASATASATSIGVRPSVFTT